MNDILNPESKNYIFKGNIHGLGEPMWVGRTLKILSLLPNGYIEKLIEKDPETIYKVYNFETIYDEAVLSNNKDLLKLFGMNKQDTNTQRYWLNSLISLSDYLYLLEDGVLNKEKVLNDSDSEIYIYSIIRKFTKNYTKPLVLGLSISQEMKMRFDENFILKEDIASIEFFLDRDIYGRQLSKLIIEENKEKINRLSLDDIGKKLKLINDKLTKIEEDYNLLLSKKDGKYSDNYYKNAQLIKYYATIKSFLENKL